MRVVSVMNPGDSPGCDTRDRPSPERACYYRLSVRFLHNPLPAVHTQAVQLSEATMEATLPCAVCRSPGGKLCFFRARPKRSQEALAIHPGCSNADYVLRSAAQLRKQHGSAQAVLAALKCTRSAAGPARFGNVSEMYIVAEFEPRLAKAKAKASAAKASAKAGGAAAATPPFLASVLSGEKQTTVGELEELGFINHKNPKGPKRLLGKALEKNCIAHRYGLIQVPKHAFSTCVMVPKYEVGYAPRWSTADADVPQASSGSGGGGGGGGTKRKAGGGGKVSKKKAAPVKKPKQLK